MRVHTKYRISGGPRSPCRLPSNCGEEFSSHLVGINPSHGVAATSIIIGNHVCVPVPVISNEIPDPIWLARFINGLAGEGNPQWV
jgi:hypothetical protein